MLDALFLTLKKAFDDDENGAPHVPLMAADAKSPDNLARVDSVDYREGRPPCQNRDAQPQRVVPRVILFKGQFFSRGLARLFLGGFTCNRLALLCSANGDLLGLH